MEGVGTFCIKSQIISLRDGHSVPWALFLSWALLRGVMYADGASLTKSKSFPLLEPSSTQLLSPWADPALGGHVVASR